ncbi:MAG TPA: helix-hairpin-helix domain-containing protein [Pyrinomonadaceae bacterium]|nr:helix-hairpin-helix domain-containing protein [Pyrinomonadaceae bacterium]
MFFTGTSRPQNRLTLTLIVAGSLLLPGCVKRSFNEQNLAQTDLRNQNKIPSISRININTASAGELEKLPGIGQALAARIVEHREKYGAFRRAEHLIIVRGISDQRFRALHDLITVE